MAKQRLDNLLVTQELCPSRQQAQRLIRAGYVKVNHQVIDKPGYEVDPDAAINIKQQERYVSRGGYKLEKALAAFQISVVDRICLDGGISTGGFTDCLLQAGAAKVYGIDVGYGQVHWQLRNDPRVILKERTNLRYLTAAELYETKEVARGKKLEARSQREAAILSHPQAPVPDFGVADVSFISLTKVLPALWDLLQSPRELMLLVKPQFEVGRERVGKKGVVKNPIDQAQAIFQVGSAAQVLGWGYRGLTWSPILGPAGNIEYLLWLGMDSQPLPVLETFIQITQSAQQTLTHSP